MPVIFYEGVGYGAMHQVKGGWASALCDRRCEAADEDEGGLKHIV